MLSTLSPSRNHQENIHRPNHTTQTKETDDNDPTTNTDKYYKRGTDSSNNANYISNEKKYLTPTKFRPGYRPPIPKPFPTTVIDYQEEIADEEGNYVPEKTHVTPTKYKLQDQRKKIIEDGKTKDSQQQSPHTQMEQGTDFHSKSTQDRNKANEKTSPSRQQSRKSSESGNDKDYEPTRKEITPTKYQRGDRQKNENKNTPKQNGSHHTRQPSSPPSSTPRYNRSRTQTESDQNPSNRNQASPSPGQGERSPSPGQRDRSSSHGQREKSPIDNTPKDQSEPVYGQYKIISGNFELRGSPSDNDMYSYKPKNTQMQLIFKATLQDPKDEESKKGHLAPSNLNTTSANNYNDPGRGQHNRPISKNDGASKDGKNNPQNNNNSYDSILSTPTQSRPQSPLQTPPTPVGLKANYNFGDGIQKELSDEENEEPECETFGHTPQSNTRRSLDFSSTQYPSSANNNNNSSFTPRFEEEKNAATNTSNQSPQQRRASSNSDRSIKRKNSNSSPKAAVYKPDESPAASSRYEKNPTISKLISSPSGASHTFHGDSDTYEQTPAANNRDSNKYDRNQSTKNRDSDQSEPNIPTHTTPKQRTNNFNQNGNDYAEPNEDDDGDNQDDRYNQDPDENDNLSTNDQDPGVRPPSETSQRDPYTGSKSKNPTKEEPEKKRSFLDRLLGRNKPPKDKKKTKTKTKTKTKADGTRSASSKPPNR